MGYRLAAWWSSQLWANTVCRRSYTSNPRAGHTRAAPHRENAKPPERRASAKTVANYSNGRGTIPNLVECFTEAPLILSFSAQARLGVLASFAAAPASGCGRGEGTPELPAARIIASSLPLGRET